MRRNTLRYCALRGLRLGLFFDMDPRFWMNLQTEYDMRMATRELKARIAPRIRVFQRVA